MLAIKRRRKNNKRKAKKLTSASEVFQSPAFSVDIREASAQQKKKK
jgi:hypothetical protein